MVDKNGIVTPVWANFFESLYKAGVALTGAVDDGTYTLSGGVSNGKITVQDGIITDVYESI